MKNTVKSIMIAFVLIVGLTQCKKEETYKGTKIENMKYEVSALNDCTTSAGTGSSIELLITAESIPSTENIYGVKLSYLFSAGGNGESIVRDLTIDILKKELTLSRCVTFGSSSSISYEAQIVMKNGDVGPPAKLILNRPSGAN